MTLLREWNTQLPRYYLGIDGGQSSTTALIADEAGRILGAGRSGPCNHVTSSEARSNFVSVVGECLDQACQQARLNPEVILFAAACLGFSGGPEDKEEYSRQLVRSLQYKITHDAEIALTGATNGEPGIIIIAGTGSMAFGRNQSGRTARAGGWGYIFGDEGGAFDIVRRALRAILQAEEGWGPVSDLSPLLLGATKCTSANQLLHYFYRDHPRQRIAALAPLVTEAAEKDDAVALSILKEAAQSLTWFIQGVHRSLFLPGQKVPIVQIGGVFQSAPLRKFVSAFLQQTLESELSLPRFPPAVGAVVEALRLDRLSPKLSNVPATIK